MATYVELKGYRNGGDRLAQCQNGTLLSLDEIAKELNMSKRNLQRALGNTNPVKLGRCFEFLNNWYGFVQGNNQYSFTKVLCGSENHNPKNQFNRLPKVSEGSIDSQENLAEMIGISVDTLQNYKKLTELVPELQDLVETGIVTKDTVLAIIKNLKKDEQRELISSMDITKKITQKDEKNIFCA